MIGRPRTARLGRAFAFALALAYACGDSPPPPPPPEPEVLPRTLLRLDQPIYQIGGRVTDTLLLSPRLLEAGNALFYLFDYGDSRLKAFATETGELRWTLGGEEQGTTLFGNPTQLSVREASPELWVLDGAYRSVRVVLGDRPGRVFALPAEPAPIERIVRMDDYAIATFSAGDGFFAPLDSLLRPTEVRPFPIPGFEAADPALRHAHVAADQHGQRWAAGFAFTRDIAIYSDSTLVCVGRVREGPPIQAVNAAATPRSWIGGLAFSEDHLLVLARSTERNRVDTVDFFAHDCSYAGSVQLPGVARAFSAGGRRMVVELEDPLPRILTYPLPN